MGAAIDAGDFCNTDAHISAMATALQLASIYKGVLPRSSPVMVFNLFALEACLVAEALNLPAAAAAPYLIPYRAPTHFRHSLQRQWPALFSQLLQALPGQASIAEVWTQCPRLRDSACIGCKAEHSTGCSALIDTQQCVCTPKCSLHSAQPPGTAVTSVWLLSCDLRGAMGNARGGM